MSPYITLVNGLLNSLNKANDVVKNEKKEDTGIIDIFITSLKKENFSDDSSIDNIKEALEAREQERESEDEIILGIEPEEESTEDTVEDKTDDTKEEEGEDIMSKFKWVLISIAIFVILLVIGGIMYWFFSLQPEETIISPNNQLNTIQKPPENVQEYSYLPFMNSASNKNHDNGKIEQDRIQHVDSQQIQRDEAERREQTQRNEAEISEQTQRNEAERSEQIQRDEAERSEQMQRDEVHRLAEAKRKEMEILEQSNKEEMERIEQSNKEEMERIEQSNKEEMEKIEQSKKVEMERLEKEATENANNVANNYDKKILAEKKGYNSDTTSSSSSSSSENKKLGGIKKTYKRRTYKKKSK